MLEPAHTFHAALRLAFQLRMIAVRSSREPGTATVIYLPLDSIQCHGEEHVKEVRCRCARAGIQIEHAHIMTSICESDSEVASLCPISTEGCLLYQSHSSQAPSVELVKCYGCERKWPEVARRVREVSKLVFQNRHLSPLLLPYLTVPPPPLCDTIR